MLMVVGLVGGCGEQHPLDSASPPVISGAAATQGALLAEIRAATAQYQNVEAAIADGYVAATPCLPNEGIRYRKLALIDGVVDPTQPELLLYEVLPNGKLHLAAVQFLVVAAAWDAIHTSPPTLGEQAFMDRRSPPFVAPPFPNYALVVWAWLHNPNGIYELFNPEVRC
jgi:hypothetical protein